MSKTSKKNSKKNSRRKTLANFLDVFNPRKGNYKNIDYLMAKVFSGTPSVGIAAGASPEGPQFDGTDEVRALFTRLTESFPELSFKAIPPYCYSPDTNANTIIVQATLKTGPHQKNWFQKGEKDVGKFYSKPLSDVPPNGKQSKVPTCAVFTFDAKNKVRRLGIYMDRWKMAEELS
jgi:hypothetical protein